MYLRLTGLYLILLVLGARCVVLEPNYQNLYAQAVSAENDVNQKNNVSITATTTTKKTSPPTTSAHTTKASTTHHKKKSGASRDVHWNTLAATLGLLAGVSVLW
ncbi:hypothetical protein FOZ63_025672 [Perkinsus olseni]|uniref:Uncharacterized protein n=1 Tax=Perkinsus olseni TaxID=32597 RepID=A0A7J6TRH3_PEROL|nr:hypothetical protein FOZ63_025672 [Perkinsus olseni]